MKSKISAYQKTRILRKLTCIQREEIENHLKKSPDFQLSNLCRELGK